MEIELRLGVELAVVVPVEEVGSDQVPRPRGDVDSVAVADPLREAPQRLHRLLAIGFVLRRHAVACPTVDERRVGNVV